MQEKLTLSQIFSQRLDEAWRKSRLKKGEIAMQLNADPTTVSRWFSGKIPESATLSRLATLLNVHADYLLGVSAETKVSPIDAAADKLIKHMDARILVAVLAEYIDELATGDGATERDARALVKKMRELRPELFKKADEPAKNEP